MVFIGQGAFYSVRVTRAEVDAFKRTYPCSGLPDKAITFQFDAIDGSLVDIYPDSESFDGPALVALSEDAQTWAEKRRNR